MKARRSGFTLIEMLVVIAIIGMLAALLLPAINRARERGRQVQCTNNQKQIAAAIIDFEGQNNRLPYYGTFSRTNPEETAGISELDFDNPRYSWYIDVLPFLERSDIADNWVRFDSQLPTNEQPLTPGQTMGSYTGIDGYPGYPNYDSTPGDTPGSPTPNQDLNEFDNYALSHKYIAIAACPNDPSAIGVDGSNSYVVNVGFIEDAFQSPNSSLNAALLDHNWSHTNLALASRGSTGGTQRDARLKQGTGVFWAGSIDGRSVEEQRVNLSQIQTADGLATTVMLTENTNAGFQPGVGRAGTSFDDLTYAYPEVVAVAFGISTRDLCGAGVDDPDCDDPYEIQGEFFSSRINLEAGADEGNSPYPSAFHPGLIIAAFCDGRVTNIQEDIDPRVWYKLVTPRGTKLPMDGTLNWMRESPLSENEF